MWTTHEVFQHLRGTDLEEHVTDSGFSNHELTDHVRDQVHLADPSAVFRLPLVAFGIIAMQSFARYKKGELSTKEAVEQGFKRGARSLVCRGAAYTTILISHEPGMGLPASVLANLVFNRFDAQRRFVNLLEEYTSVLHERRRALESIPA